MENTFPGTPPVVTLREIAFFESMTFIPRFHSSGTAEAAQQALSRSVKVSAGHWSPDLSSLGRISSRPAALPFFFVSATVIMARLTGRSIAGMRRP